MRKKILAIEGGGNFLRRGIVDPQGVISGYFSKKMTFKIHDLKTFVSQNITSDCEGVAIAMPGTIENGIVVNSPQLPMFNGINIKEEVEVLTRLPCEVMNDMEASATGFAKIYSDENLALVMTIGSGVGGRYILNGKVISDSEIGHIVIDAFGYSDECGCHNYGCAETFFGGEAMKRRIMSQIDLHKLTLPSGMHPVKFLEDSFTDNQLWAQKLCGLYADDLGLYLGNLQMTLRVPCIIFKGGFALRFLPRLEKRVRDRMVHVAKMNPRWVSEENLRFIYGNEASHDALIGAAECFRQVRV